MPNTRTQTTTPQRSFSFAEVDPLSPNALSHLKSYKYSSVDKSPISHYILRHYWNACVEFLPLWLAPNLVTLLGFLFILVNILLLQLYIPDLVGPGPTWVYYSFGFGLWMYSTMDNIDGKQARRTGSSSPLGELFDHGIDSLNCTLGSILETAAMGLGATPVGAFTALIPCGPMFFSTWETYHTHTLYLGFFNGPTEGLILACSAMIFSGIYGPGFWRLPLSVFLPYSSHLPETLTTLSLLDLWVPMILFSLFFIHIPFCIYNVVSARQRSNLPVLPIFLEWMPFLIYIASTTLWLGSPYSTLLSSNRLLLFCLTMSFVFGRLTTKIILCHLTRQPFPFWTVQLVPLVVGAVLANLPRLGLTPVFDEKIELAYLLAYFVFAGIAYMGWALKTIDRICSYLDINCLTIKHPKAPHPPQPKGRDAEKTDLLNTPPSNGKVNGEVRSSGRRRQAPK